MKVWSAVDLHAHTNASDGALAPAELVGLAASRGLKYLAVTDHDTTAGVEAAVAEGSRLGVEVVPGVELGTDVDGHEVHILGYFVDWRDEAFQTTLLALRDGRVGRARAMLDKLAALGAPIAWSRVLEIAGDAAIGRPHIARALVEAGHVASMGDAFDRYIGDDGPAYAQRLRLDPAEAVAEIRRVGGVPGLAHPAYVHGDRIVHNVDLDVVLGRLVGSGLGAIECYYAGYTPDLTNHLLAYARRHGLVPTGGSDFHGSGVHEGVELGGVAVPVESVDALRRLANR